MKVRIIKCSNKDWWHLKYVGQEVDVAPEEWSWDAYFAPKVKYFGAVLPKKDCEVIDMINFNEYQDKSQRTINPELNRNEQIINAALGLAGEAGEVVDHIKKAFYQGHVLDHDKILDELGDVLWYIAGMCTALEEEMNEVAILNINKLRKRYPEKFDASLSINRE